MKQEYREVGFTILAVFFMFFRILLVVAIYFLGYPKIRKQKCPEQSSPISFLQIPKPVVGKVCMLEFRPSEFAHMGLSEDRA